MNTEYYSIPQSEMQSIIEESIQTTNHKYDWKTYQSVADSLANSGGDVDWQIYHNLMNAAREVFEKEYGFANSEGYLSIYVDDCIHPNKIACTILKPDGKCFKTTPPCYITDGDFYGQNGRHQPGKWCVGVVIWCGGVPASPDFDTYEEAKAYAEERGMRLTAEDTLPDTLYDKQKLAYAELNLFYRNNPKDRYMYIENIGWQRMNISAYNDYDKMKRKYPNDLLLIETDDCYETFGDDAAICSKILGLDLILRTDGKGRHNTRFIRFPNAQLDSYIAKLNKACQRVAVCV